MFALKNQSFNTNSMKQILFFAFALRLRIMSTFWYKLDKEPFSSRKHSRNKFTQVQRIQMCFFRRSRDFRHFKIFRFSVQIRYNSKTFVIVQRVNDFANEKITSSDGNDPLARPT